jgi:hypothetical protein
MNDLKNVLNGVNGGRLSVDRPVIDRTHLAGDYNIQFRTEIENHSDDFGGAFSCFRICFRICNTNWV